MTVMKIDDKFVNELEANEDYTDETKTLLQKASNTTSQVEKREIVNKRRGPKIQKYSIDGQNLIMTFNSYAEMLRLAGESYAQSCVRRAIKQNSIYKKFRWIHLDQELPNDTKQELKPPCNNVSIKTKDNNHMIALLNNGKTKILHLFPDQVSVLKFLDMNPLSANIRNALNSKMLVSNQYYVERWEDCKEELKNVFLEHNSLPQTRSQFNTKPIIKSDEDGNVVHRINSLQNFCNELMIGRKKAVEILRHPNKKHMGFYWKYEEKDDDINSSFELKIEGENEQIEKTKDIDSGSTTYEPNKAPRRKHSAVIGQKCQRYTQEGRLIKTYDSFTEIFTDPEIKNPSITAMKNAFRDKKIYRDFIWLKLPRDCPDDTYQDINDPIIKNDSQPTHAQRPKIILEWKNGEIVKKWDSYNMMCKILKIGKVRLFSILDNHTEFNGSFWTREQ